MANTKELNKYAMDECMHEGMNMVLSSEWLSMSLSEAWFLTEPSFLCLSLARARLLTFLKTQEILSAQKGPLVAAAPPFHPPGLKASPVGGSKK